MSGRDGPGCAAALASVIGLLVVGLLVVLGVVLLLAAAGAVDAWARPDPLAPLWRVLGR